MLIAAAMLAVAPVSVEAATPVQLEIKTWELFKARRTNAFEALFARDYVALYATGPRDLGHDMQAAFKVSLREYHLSAMHSHAIDADDVLLTYAADVDAVVGSKPDHHRLWVATLWHRNGGRWLAAYHSEIRAQ
jgi:hypothetical protein